MDVLVTGASGLIGAALRPALVRCGTSTGRAGSTARSRRRRDLVGSGERAPRPGVDRGCRRRDPPRGCRYRRQAMDRRAETAAAREPCAVDRSAGACDRRSARAATGARERVGDRILRRPRRRDPHREERPRRRVPHRALPSMGSGDSARRAGGHGGRRTSDRGSSSPRRAARSRSCSRSSGSASAGASARGPSGRAGSRSTTRSQRSSTC